jgi:hypothetical protein
MAEEVKENKEVKENEEDKDKVKKRLGKEYHNKIRQCEYCSGTFSYNTKFRHDKSIKHMLGKKDKEIEEKTKELEIKNKELKIKNKEIEITNKKLSDVQNKMNSKDVVISYVINVLKKS